MREMGKDEVWNVWIGVLSGFYREGGREGGLDCLQLIVVNFPVFGMMLGDTIGDFQKLGFFFTNFLVRCVGY